MLCFIKDEEVIGHGVIYLHLISLMYVLPAVTNGIQGYFRGIGDLKITLNQQFCKHGCTRTCRCATCPENASWY